MMMVMVSKYRDVTNNANVPIQLFKSMILSISMY